MSKVLTAVAVGVQLKLLWGLNKKMERVDAKTGALAAYGLGRGLVDVFIIQEAKRNPALFAWGAIALFAGGYDYIMPPEKSLSSWVHNTLDKHPVLTTIAVGATALHFLKAPHDPYAAVLKALK